MGNRVLVLAAHPDDELLGVGGTIRRHVENDDDVYVYLDGKCRQPSWEKSVEVCNRLGASLVTHFEHGPQQPDIVYTHHPGDLNADHRRVAEQALVIGRFARTVRTFETLSSTEWGLTPFLPDFYVGIDIKAKVADLAIYGDEMRGAPHPRSYVAVEALATLRGSTAGLPAAEAFHTIRDRW